MGKLKWHRILLDALIVVITVQVITIIVVVGYGLRHKDSAAPKPAATHSEPTPQSDRPAPATPAFSFPSGGKELLPAHRLVALYGSPDAPRLGVLGEQPADQAIRRVQALAAEYQALGSQKAYPTFEIITTVASASPTPNNDYSNELPIEKIQPWVQAARQAGVYVVLDLQPGRSDFLTQAKLYESLLKEPHVGLALDPEWRLLPDQMHMKQIGSVTAAEVNQVSAWLQQLVAANKLPPKLFLLHQFRLSMIANREQLNTSHSGLNMVIQMDGNGAQATKQSTWRSIMQNPPPGVLFGWKNFYDEDTPMLTVPETMGVSPQPAYISYQ